MTQTLRRPVAAAALFLFAMAPLASASAQPASDPVLSRIYRVGTDSSQLATNAQRFFDVIGPRLTGTEMQDAASRWVLGLYEQWGVTGRQEQVGTWRGWRRGHSHIDLVTPRLRTLEGTMLAWSPGTRKKDVVASTIVLPRFADSTEFVRWLPQAR
jgi:hypothetical protein